MRIIRLRQMGVKVLFVALFVLAHNCFSQKTEKASYIAGFKVISLIDSSRLYKPETAETDPLHHRPLDLDIWYPSESKSSEKLLFRDLFGLFEKRANKYQDSKDYTGMMEELAQFYAAGLGLEMENGNVLLNIETDSYQNPPPAMGKWPVIIYMAGFNGMAFENYKILENLVKSGYFVVSISSIGRYPGDMTNEKMDMMEQVYDAEFAISALKKQTEFNLDLETIGLLGYSWGGMSAAVMLDRNPGIKAMISLDGTETHYFGESEVDDGFLNEIHNADLIHPEKITCPYLFMESRNTFEDFIPTREYHYFKKMNSSKSYFRFIDGKHEDFSCIPSLLAVSDQSVNIYKIVNESSLLFFNKHLKKEKGFDSFHQQILKNENVTGEPYEINPGTPEKLIFTGIISDSKTGEKLPYVNIGVLNKDIGTVTDNQGVFDLRLDKYHIDDTIRVSMIGYMAKTFPVRDLFRQNDNNQIILEEEIPELTEVVITAKSLKLKTLGNKTESKFLSTGFFYDQLGAEMGIKVNIRKVPTFVDAFNFNISYNRLSAKSFFRLNIYNIENGKAFHNILDKNIIIPIAAKQTGVISIDLKKYDIVLKDDVIVTLEWVDNEGDLKKGEGIYFSLGLFSRGTYVRNSSQGKMKKHRGFGVGFNMNVRY